jgi:hypothetical protein
MDEKKSTDGQQGIWIRRVARIWSIPIILYTFLLAGGYTWSWVTTGTADPYVVEEVSFLEMLPPILMFFSVIGLAIAWRWERLGGLITLGFQLLTIIALLIERPLTGGELRFFLPYLLAIIVAVPGALFWAYWRVSSKTETSHTGV